jgi:hypothetical protein
MWCAVGGSRRPDRHRARPAHDPPGPRAGAGAGPGHAASRVGSGSRGGREGAQSRGAVDRAGRGPAGGCSRRERRPARRGAAGAARGAAVVTYRAGFARAVLDRAAPDLIVLSPGPGRPCDFDVSGSLAAEIARRIPVFGVCLGKAPDPPPGLVSRGLPHAARAPSARQDPPGGRGAAPVQRGAPRARDAGEHGLDGKAGADSTLTTPARSGPRRAAARARAAGALAAAAGSLVMLF